MNLPPSSAITFKEPSRRALQLANLWGVPCMPYAEIDHTNYRTLLLISDHQTTILHRNNRRWQPCDWGFNQKSLFERAQKANLKNEALARAMGAKPKDAPSMIDATAGLGRDSFILASLGFQVTMIERSPIVHYLLQEALSKAPKKIAERLHLIHGDAQNLFIKHQADIIYLDPMFPKQARKASQKKEMLILSDLVQEPDNSHALFKKAYQTARKRVLVKRPKWDAPLAKSAPTFSIHLKASRLDVYIL